MRKGGIDPADKDDQLDAIMDNNKAG